MPKQPVRRDSTGAYWTVDEGSQNWRPLQGTEHGQMRPTRVLNQMGVDWNDRLDFKWFAANPQQGMELLRVKGYEVLPYGNGFNAAVRRPGEKDWKLVDPHLFSSAGEFFRDVADLLMDGIQGTAVSVGIASGAAAGGPLGAAAGGAAGGAVSEFIRQAIGSAIGTPDNIKAGEIAFQGVAGAVTPAIGKGLGLAARGVGKVLNQATKGTRRVTAEVVDFVLGGKERSGLDVTTTLLERNAMRFPNGRFIPIETPEDAVGIIRSYLDSARGGQNTIIGRLNNLRDRFIRVVEDQGATRGVNLHTRNIFRTIRNVEGTTGAQQAGGVNLGSDPAVSRLNKEINSILGGPPTEATVAQMLRDVMKTRGMRVTDAQFQRMAAQAFRQSNQAYDKALGTTRPSVAIEILKRMDEWIRSNRQAFAEAGLSAGAPVQTASRRTVNQVKNIAKELNGLIKDSLGGHGGRYANLQGEISRKINAHSRIRDFMGTKAVPSSGAESQVISNLLKGKSDFRQAFKEFDDAFGTFDGVAANGPDFTALMRRLGIGLFFTPEGTQGVGRFGVPRLRPRFTAFGQSIGAGALVGAGFGSGVLGAGVAAAGIVGTVLASPRTLTRLAPHAVNMANAAQRIASRLQLTNADTASVRILSSAALQEASRAGTHFLGRQIAHERPRQRRSIDLTR